MIVPRMQCAPLLSFHSCIFSFPSSFSLLSALQLLYSLLFIPVPSAALSCNKPMKSVLISCSCTSVRLMLSSTSTIAVYYLCCQIYGWEDRKCIQLIHWEGMNKKKSRLSLSASFTISFIFLPLFLFFFCFCSQHPRKPTSTGNPPYIRDKVSGFLTMSCRLSVSQLVAATWSMHS